MIPTYTMYGKTIRVFPFRPNWSSNVVESLEWKTDVLKARNGTEQRRSLRVVPRRWFEYKAWIKGENARLFESLLWDWQARNFALPVWTDIGRLSSGVSAGASTLPVDTTLLGFRADDYALIYANERSYELVELSSVTPTSLGLSAAITGNWPAGTRVFPLIVAHMLSSVQLSRHTSYFGEAANLIFASSPDTTYDHIDNTASPSVMYDGIEVVTHKPNWGSPINNDFQREFDTVDTGVGPVGYYETETTGRIVRPFSWLLKTRADIAEFRSFVGRMRGQAKTCWIPSWHDDFTLAGTILPGSTTITVSGTEFYDLVGVDTSRNRIAINTGTQTFYRQVTAMVPNYVGNTTQLTINSALGTTVASAKISLLLRCRLATDKIVIPWHTDGVATPQTTFTTVKI